MNCPCGRTEAYEACCERFVSGAEPAPGPEALMRSRYSAYAMQKIEYLYETHHPDTRDSFDRTAAAEWAEAATWNQLEIVDAATSDDNLGFVEFKAHYSEDGTATVHHERSRFVRIDGFWVYADGTILSELDSRASKKIGRNDPCPCGSGKKYKKCCLKRGD